MAEDKFDIFSRNTERKLEKSSRKSHTVKILLVLLAVFLIVFILKPGLEGYGIYREVEKTNYSLQDFAANVQDLRFELSTTKSNLSLYSQMNGQLQEQLASTSIQLTACLGEKAALQATVDSSEKISEQSSTLFQQQLDEKQKKINELEQQKTGEINSATSQCTTERDDAQKQLQTVQTNYDLLLKNSARTICCKQKVDNPDITAYSVLEQKVVCLEEGGTVLQC